MRMAGPLSHDGTSLYSRQLLVCKFEGGKRTVGGQKLTWVDIVMRDLKKC